MNRFPDIIVKQEMHDSNVNYAKFIQNVSPKTVISKKNVIFVPCQIILLENPQLHAARGMTLLCFIAIVVAAPA